MSLPLSVTLFIDLLKICTSDGLSFILDSLTMCDDNLQFNLFTDFRMRNRLELVLAMSVRNISVWVFCVPSTLVNCVTCKI